MTLSIDCVLESAVFFPGDTLFCRIHISNKSTNIITTTSSQQQSNKANESISWITTQVYGNMIVEPKYFKLSTSSPKLGSSAGNTTSTTASSSILLAKKQQQQKKSTNIGAFGGLTTATSLPNITDTGDNGRSIFASPTTILGSDIQIPAGQTRSFIYYLTLPSSLPPSFKGTSLRYSYFLSIAAQLFTHPAQILTIPIRILTPASALRQLKFKLNISNHDYEEGSTETPQESSKSLEIVSKWPISAFKKSQYFPLPYPQTISQYDSNNTRKSVIDILNKYSVPVSINISKGSEKLATFSILKTAFTLGDTVCGTFDFSIATIPCYKILVKLECEETIEPKYQQSSRSKSNRRLYGELHEYTTNVRQTHFMFHIPVEASQEFSTKHVSVKWILKFEFVTPMKNPYQNLQQQQHHHLQQHLHQTPTSISRSNSLEMVNSHESSLSSSSSSTLQPNKSAVHLAKSSSYNEDLGRHQQHHTQNNNSNHQQTLQIPPHNNQSSLNNNGNGSTTSTPQTVSPTHGNSQHPHSMPSTPPHHLHHLSKSTNNRVISEVPSDSESNISSDSGAMMISEDVLHSSTNSYTRANNVNTSGNTAVTNQQYIRRYENNPVVGVLINNDENNVPLVDTLHWSLPIRVLVCSPPHELLHQKVCDSLILDKH